MSPLGNYQNTNYLDPVAIKYPTTKKINSIPEDDDLNNEIKDVKAKLDLLRESQAKSPKPVNITPVDQGVSPLITKDKNRKIVPIEDIFKTSGVFSKANHKDRKKSKYWGADELMALMGSVSKKKKQEEDDESSSKN